MYINVLFYVPNKNLHLRQMIQISIANLFTNYDIIINDMYADGS